MSILATEISNLLIPRRALVRNTSGSTKDCDIEDFRLTVTDDLAGNLAEALDPFYQAEFKMSFAEFCKLPDTKIMTFAYREMKMLKDALIKLVGVDGVNMSNNPVVPLGNHKDTGLPRSLVIFDSPGYFGVVDIEEDCSPLFAN